MKSIGFLFIATFAILLVQPIAFGAFTNSPKAQLESGVDLHAIKCNDGFSLVLKAKDWSPACVKSSNVERLISLGWAANHDAQHQKMMESEKMAAEKKANEPEPTVDEPETKTTDKVNHVINLTESMEMAGN